MTDIIDRSTFQLDSHTERARPFESFHNVLSSLLIV